MPAKKIFFKFKKGAKPPAREKALALLRAEGATGVRRVFPRAASPELAAVYVAAGSSASSTRKLMRLLKSRDEIDYAQGEVARRPLRDG